VGSAGSGARTHGIGALAKFAEVALLGQHLGQPVCGPIVSREGEAYRWTRRVEVAVLLERQRFRQRDQLREPGLRALDRRHQLRGPLTGHHTPRIPPAIAVEQVSQQTICTDGCPGMVIVLVKYQAS
jgi:hypothetical protein